MGLFYIFVDIFEKDHCNQCYTFYTFIKNKIKIFGRVLKIRFTHTCCSVLIEVSIALFLSKPFSTGLTLSVLVPYLKL